jgi:RNA polymerase sigma-70 factor, ECF subfamily
MLSLEQEQELVERARQGDDEAYEALILAFTAPLYRVVQRMANDAQEAEYVLQESFWRAWRSLGRYQSDRPFFPYLVTVALNVQRDRWRAGRKLDERDLEEVGELIDPVSAPEILIENEEQSMALVEAVRNLPEDYRVVIALRYQAEMTYEEIAETLKLPINTVRTHLFRAKQILRKSMEEYNG